VEQKYWKLEPMDKYIILKKVQIGDFKNRTKQKQSEFWENMVWVKINKV
jgi:hypothetical protein